MKFKYLVIVGFILAIITMGAVSASEDASDNMTVDEGAEIEEAPSDDVIANEGGDDVVADTDKDIISDDDDKYAVVTPSDFIRWGDDNSIPVYVINLYNINLTGQLVLKADGKTFYQKDIVVKSRSVYSLTASMLNDMPVGKFMLNATFTPPNGLKTVSDGINVEVMPDVNYLNYVPSNADHYIDIMAPASFSGTAYVYVYDEATDKETDLVTQAPVNGITPILMPKLQKGTYLYIIKFKSPNYNPNNGIIIELHVLDNNPNVTASVTPLEVIVGSPVTITAEGPFGVFVYYLDGKFADYNESVTSFKRVVSNLTVGQHRINVIHYDAEGDLDFIQLFVVTVKAKPVPVTPKDTVKLTLKKVKVKKSAKKLVLTATLKINGKAKKGLKIKFKFNKKTYTAKTNKKGVAKVTIKKKVLKKLKVGKKVKIQASYGNTVKKLTVKVKK